MRKQTILSVTLLCVSTLILGCGDGFPPRAPVQGIVVYEDGTPVAGAAVMFHPEEGLETKNSMGVTDQDGKFVMYTYRDARDPDGASIGSHTVTVSGVTEGAVPLNSDGEVDETMSGTMTWFVNSKFALKETSPLTITVEKGMGPVELPVTK